LVASCFRGALPPVDLRAVCFVRAILVRELWSRAKSPSKNVESVHYGVVYGGNEDDDAMSGSFTRERRLLGAEFWCRAPHKRTAMYKRSLYGRLRILAGMKQNVSRNSGV
jgi:hypothetical protein